MDRAELLRAEAAGLDDFDALEEAARDPVPDELRAEVDFELRR